jgi:hypothetical protein
MAAIGFGSAANPALSQPSASEMSNSDFTFPYYQNAVPAPVNLSLCLTLSLAEYRL